MDGRRSLADLQQIDDPGHAPNRVVDVGEVEGAFRTVDANGAARVCCACERGDDTVRMIAGSSVHVGESDRRSTQPPASRIVHQPLALNLRASVDVDGAERRVLGGGQIARLPVDFATAGEDEPRLPFLFFEGLEDVAQSPDVCVPAPFGIAFAPEDAGDRSKMDDAIAAAKGIPHPREAPHVTVLAAGPEKIQPDDLLPSRFERHSQGATDQPLGAGNQNAVAHA